VPSGAGSEPSSDGDVWSAEDSAPVLVAVRGAASDPVSAVQSAPGLDPLPRRVRLAGLVAELREPRPVPDAPSEPEAMPSPIVVSTEPSRSSAAIGAFQRQSRIARAAEETRPEPIREEDRS
jgi:hypothetical protein